jgi:hypothetical protein
MVSNVVRIGGMRGGSDGCHGRARSGCWGDAREMWRRAGEKAKSFESKTMVYLCLSLPWARGIFRNAKTIVLFIHSIISLLGYIYLLTLRPSHWPVCSFHALVG